MARRCELSHEVGNRYSLISINYIRTDNTRVNIMKPCVIKKEMIRIGSGHTAKSLVEFRKIVTFSTQLNLLVIIHY